LPNFESSENGDQYVKVVIKTPTKLNKKMRELIKELGQEEQKIGGWKKKILKRFKTKNN